MKLLIFLVFSQYGLAYKYGIIFKYQYILACKIAFLMSDVTIPNQARLQQKPESTYFLKERCFSLFIFKVDLNERLKTINVCLLFLRLKLDTKEATANEIIHLEIFIKFIKEN